LSNPGTYRDIANFSNNNFLYYIRNDSYVEEIDGFLYNNDVIQKTNAFLRYLQPSKNSYLYRVVASINHTQKTSLLIKKYINKYPRLFTENTVEIKYTRLEIKHVVVFVFVNVNFMELKNKIIKENFLHIRNNTLEILYDNDTRYIDTLLHATQPSEIISWDECVEDMVDRVKSQEFNLWRGLEGLSTKQEERMRKMGYLE
jgi:hypothetical protein